MPRVLKIEETYSLLLVPFQKTNGKDTKPTFYGCMGLKLTRDEEKIIQNVLDTYKEIAAGCCQVGQEWNLIREKRLQGVSYRTMLPGGFTLTTNEVLALEKCPEQERSKLLAKKSIEQMLLCLDSGNITVYSCKKKDEIDLKNGECEILMLHNMQGISEDDKYQFTIVYQEKGLIGGNNQKKLTLGTDSEAARRDWAFSIMLAAKWGSDQG